MNTHFEKPIALFIGGDEALKKRIVSQLGDGFQLDAAGTSAEATQRLLMHPYALILIEQQIPGANGITLLNHIRRTMTLPAPMLMIFDEEDPDLIAFAKDAGIHDYILVQEIEETTVLPRLAAQLVKRSQLEAEIGKIQRQMREIASIDPLTDAYNRRYFEARILREFTRSRYRDDRLSIGMIDVDNFKSVNDSHGHLMGDVVLREIADIIRSHLRHSDILCRYGGDEFLILFPNTPQEEAILICGQIQEHIAAHVFQNGDDKTRTSVSIGLIPLADHHANHDSLLHEADQHLYRAKRQGKNCVYYN